MSADVDNDTQRESNANPDSPRVMPAKKTRSVPEPRKGQGDVKLSRDDFARRLHERFHDPTFDAASAEIDRIVEIAWRNYDEYHKSPRKQPAGPGFADPTFELPQEWLATRQAIHAAQRHHDDPHGASRILLVCGAAHEQDA